MLGGTGRLADRTPFACASPGDMGRCLVNSPITLCEKRFGGPPERTGELPVPPGRESAARTLHRRGPELWGARSSRVLAKASRLRGLSMTRGVEKRALSSGDLKKFVSAGRGNQPLGTSALPGCHTFRALQQHTAWYKDKSRRKDSDQRWTGRSFPQLPVSKPAILGERTARPPKAVRF